MASSSAEREVSIPLEHFTLQGNLHLVEGALGLVLFAHGSGSSRHSRRNRYVAHYLNEHRLGTFLLDLLSPEEEEADRFTGHLRFDIGLLAKRLSVAAHWLQQEAATNGMPVGLFGSSTGGGAALMAAAHEPELFAAVVSRGGRPDLAGAALAHVRCPTLLIVGGDDLPVIEMNREAMDQLRCRKEMQIVPGASHLFEEPGALQQVAALASQWFELHLAGT